MRMRPERLRAVTRHRATGPAVMTVVPHREPATSWDVTVPTRTAQGSACRQGASVLGLSVVPALAGVVADAARHGAKRHGLICYDPREQLVDPNAPGAPSFTLSSARLAPVPDPDEALLELTVRGLSADNFFVVLERSDGWFVQVGVGRRAGAADDTYALEFQDGTPEGHFRCETTDLAQAARLLREFRAGDDRWRHRHPWRPLQW